jgi:hypothetical protein
VNARLPTLSLHGPAAEEFIGRSEGCSATGPVARPAFRRLAAPEPLPEGAPGGTFVDGVRVAPDTLVPAEKKATA